MKSLLIALSIFTGVCSVGWACMDSDKPYVKDMGCGDSNSFQNGTSSEPVCGSTQTIETDETVWIWFSRWDDRISKIPESAFYYLEEAGQRLRCYESDHGYFIKYKKVYYEVEWGYVFPDGMQIGKREDGMAVIRMVEPPKPTYIYKPIPSPILKNHLYKMNTTEINYSPIE